MKEIKSKIGFKFIKNEDKDIISCIKEYFEEPSIFLKKNNQIGIGKSSIRQRNILINNIILSKNPNKNSNTFLKSLKGINNNMETGINLSTIPNLSLNQKTCNSKEEIPIPINNLNTITLSKEINNEEANSKLNKNNCLFDSKKENNNFLNNENNKEYPYNLKNIPIFNIEKTSNIYSITEESNNGKNKGKRFSIHLLRKKNENEKKNKENLNKKNIIKIQYPITNYKRPLSVNIHYQYKSKNEIINSFLLGKKREEESKSKGTNNFIPNEVEENIKREYLNQEKNIKENVIHSYRDKNISNYLSKKCNKKEAELLYNNIENYRIKKQLLENLENNKILSEKLGDKYWYVNLRRPIFLKEPRSLYLNIGKNEKNIWEPIVEFPMKNVEIIKKTETPHKENNNFEKFLKEKHLYPKNLFNPNKKYINKGKNKMPNLTEMNDMIVKGKNMILYEKENFLDDDKKLNLTGRKYRVFKDPRENNSKYSKDCLFILDYNYEGLPYKTKIGIKKNKRNKTLTYNSISKVKKTKK